VKRGRVFGKPNGKAGKVRWVRIIAKGRYTLLLQWDVIGVSVCAVVFM
jgi:hypothetical protein